MTSGARRSPFATTILWLALTIAIVMSLACVCRAEDGVTVAELGLTDALSKAIGTNVAVKRAENDYLETLSNTKIADIRTSAEFGSEASFINQSGASNLDNLVYSSVTYASLYGSEATLDVSPFALGAERGSIELSVSRPLIRGRGRMSDQYNKIAAAKSALKVESKQLYLSKQDTALAVIKAYYRAVEAQDLIKVQESALENAKIVATGARKKADAGYVAEIEATRFEIQVAQATNELSLQRQAAKGAMLDLMLAIGSGVGEQPRLTDVVPETMPEVPTLEETLDRAIKNRQEMAIADERVSNQKRLLAVAKDQLRPSLAAVAGFNSTHTDAGLISRSIFDVGEFAAGLQYKIPLDRRATKEQHQIATRELDILERQREYQRESIAQEVGQAYRSVESQRESLKIFTESLKVAEQSLDLARRMEEAGGSNRDVLDAQLSLTETRNSILSAKTELYLAILNLKNVMGESIYEMGEQ